MNAWDGARSGEILLADETGQKQKGDRGRKARSLP